MNGVKDYDTTVKKLTQLGYGDQLDDLLTLDEYVTQRARMDRNYNAGWYGAKEGDADYAEKKKSNDQVNLDYLNYLSKYVRKKIK